VADFRARTHAFAGEGIRGAGRVRCVHKEARTKEDKAAVAREMMRPQAWPQAGDTRLSRCALLPRLVGLIA